MVQTPSYAVLKLERDAILVPLALRLPLQQSLFRACLGSKGQRLLYLKAVLPSDREAVLPSSVLIEDPVGALKPQPLNVSAQGVIKHEGGLKICQRHLLQPVVSLASLIPVRNSLSEQFVVLVLQQRKVGLLRCCAHLLHLEAVPHPHPVVLAHDLVARAWKVRRGGCGAEEPPRLTSFVSSAPSSKTSLRGIQVPHDFRARYF
mmetsp:Transcript_8602/g.17463  ORF Transcript_8602/g.17463 Transcript_8602/m.17463 type:complete len:204 (-) Transcript_8602:584-1195(-)